MTDPRALQRKWDARYRGAEGPLAAAVLRENAHLLPNTGRGLDLACGLGANALLLARSGLQVDAWDLSAVAIERLAQRAREESLPIRALARDVLAQPPEPLGFDVIVVAHFLQRELFPALLASLRPGGLLFYQTFIRDTVSGQGPSNADFRLDRNELLRLCGGLIVRVYREEGRLGDLTEGWRDMAMLVAERPE